MNNKTKILLYTIPLIMAVLFPARVVVQKQQAEAQVKVGDKCYSGNADKVSGVIKIDKGLDGGTVGVFTMNGKDKFAVTSIPKWKLDIYNKLGLSENHKLMLHTLNTMECGDWDGFCENHADAGPFQINQIHGKDHDYSLYLVRQGKIARDNAIKSGDYKTVNAIRDTLFAFQVKWTVARMETFRKKCTFNKLSEIMKCQAVRHNGNTKPNKAYGQFRFWYGTKASKSISILYDYYLTK